MRELTTGLAKNSFLNHTKQSRAQKYVILLVFIIVLSDSSGVSPNSGARDV